MKHVSEEEMIHGVRSERDGINSIDGCIGLGRRGRDTSLPERSSGEVRMGDICRKMCNSGKMIQ